MHCTLIRMKRSGSRTGMGGARILTEQPCVRLQFAWLIFIERMIRKFRESAETAENGEGNMFELAEHIQP